MNFCRKHIDRIRLKPNIIIITFFLFVGSAWSKDNSNYTISKNHLHNHVVFLSSDALEGRLTGSKGEKLAIQYAADLFQHLGLEPAGDNGTFFQTFDFISGVSLGESNHLTISYLHGSKKNLILNKEWRPLSFSENNSFTNTTLVFAGYGITSPSYDSYQGLNVKNKWVMVFRYLPEKISTEKRRKLYSFSSLRYKAFIARKNGAKGIIFVSGPNSKVKNELIPLSFETSISDAGIIAISISDAIANEMLSSQHITLKQLQDKLDAGKTNQLLNIVGLKFVGKIDLHQKKQQGHNVLAKLKINSRPTPLLIVGAHIDHLGHGEFSHSRSEQNQIHHGADDNASGVASVLEAATKLSILKKQGKIHGHADILFGLWSGEEIGLLGSSYFIKSLMQKNNNKSLRQNIDTYINLDMVGRLRKSLILQGIGSSSCWSKIIDHTNQSHHLSVITQNDSYLPTDSTAFYLHNIPALNFFTGSHDEYHTPRDTLDTLNFDGMKNITKFLVDLILTLENQSTLIDFKKIEKTPAHYGRSFRIYFGTIPDYASTDRKGVKLAGVTPDSPSAHAGVKPNDVIVELAGKKIQDIYDYTYVLSALHAKHPVALVVMRDEKRVTLTIVPQSRE